MQSRGRKFDAFHGLNLSGQQRDDAPAPQVVEAMLPFLTEFYGNPSSVHRFGQYSRKAIDDARVAVAALVGCREGEITFTGGGTESVNTAIRGLLAARSPRKRIITSTVEHSATRELCQQLGREGFEIVMIGVDGKGMPDLAGLAAALKGEGRMRRSPVMLRWFRCCGRTMRQA